MFNDPSKLPWHVLTNPVTQWERLPTFLLGEWAIIFAAALALVHARRTDRAHVLVWIAALAAGTANDLIFMALPLVDNFWHGQATVMLSPRLPLYIPCMYVLFMYYPTVAASRFRLSRWSTAALAGLIAVVTYAPFDIVGVKYLWWTWHDTDGPIQARLLGVPTSSTLWVLTFAGTFAWLVSPALLAKEPPSGRALLFTLLRVAALTTLVMMPQMILLQTIDGGRPAYRALTGGIVVYAAMAAWGLRGGTSPRVRDRLPFVGILPYLGVLVVSIVAFDPAKHVSIGVHQTVGPCDVTATDIAGATRRAYLCVDNYDEDYDVSCMGKPAYGTRWYTICGRPFTRRGAWIAAALLLCAQSAFVYLLAFGGTASRRPGDRLAPT